MHIQKRILFFALLTLSTFTYGQSFEGTLMYKVTYDIKVDSSFGISKNQLIETLKKTDDYFDTLVVHIKNGSYEKLTNSKNKKRIVYKPSERKLYTLEDGFEFALILDTKKYIAFDIEFEKPIITQNDSITTIAGKDCKSISLNWEGFGEEVYFYNDSFLKIDPELFKGHQYEYFYEILQYTKSYPVQINKSLNQLMEIQMTLIDYKTQDINDSSFDIPELEPVKDKEYADIIKQTTGSDVMRIKN